jgi:hypothetical protein
MATKTTTRDQLVKKLAYEYVCFNHDPNTKYLVVDVTDDCMIELEGMSGLFAPDLFQLASMAQPAPGTSGEWRVQAMPTHGWRVVDATEQEVVADVYREEDARQIVSDHNAVPKLVAALKDALFEAEVSTVLWHQSRGFVGTVEDAYDKGLMPHAFVRARAALAAVGREGERDEQY